MSTCGRCLGLIEGYPATSRVDSTTELCSECAIDEAFDSYTWRQMNWTNKEIVEGLKAKLKVTKGQ